MNTTIKREKASRVASSSLSLPQEDALIGIMYDDFHHNRMQHLDYNKIRKYAFELQTDPQVCASLDAEPCGEGEVWEPSDDWITDMCLAFRNAAREQANAKKASAFGGGRDEYDPKNPHARSPEKRTPPRSSRSPTRGKTPRSSPTARKAAALEAAAASATNSAASGWTMAAFLGRE